MKNRLTEAELTSYKFLKEKAKNNRLKICKERDIEYSKRPGGIPIDNNYKVSDWDMRRPLQDFMNTDDFIKFSHIRSKLSK